MTLHLFTNIITLGDSFIPIAKGVGSGKVVWLTAKARTNGFTVASNDNALDGFRVAAGAWMLCIGPILLLVQMQLLNLLG